MHGRGRNEGFPGHFSHETSMFIGNQKPIEGYLDVWTLAYSRGAVHAPDVQGNLDTARYK